MARIYNKPALGIMPKYLWEEQRITNINEAIERMTQSQERIPVEWITEYNELCERKQRLISKEACNLRNGRYLFIGNGEDCTVVGLLTGGIVFSGTREECNAKYPVSSNGEQNPVAILLADTTLKGMQERKDEYHVVDCITGSILFTGTGEKCKAKYPNYVNYKPV